jgi:predicted alpha/beta-hydrolase family hydrolase
MNAPVFLFDGPARASLTVVLAHGAGAPMDSPFMNDIAAGLGARGLRVARFEFPYMAARRHGGPRRGPDPPAALEAAWLAAIEALGGGKRVVAGGKSMGGRIASMVADRAGVHGLLCLGYPFHPPGRPQQTRTAHLATLRTRTLIVQGERDALGTRADVAGYTLSGRITVRWLEDGDHSFKPRARSGHTLAAHMARAIEWSAEFVGVLADPARDR